MKTVKKNMTDYFEKVSTRLNMTLGGVRAWCWGEELVGLKNSLFICENGKLSQYVDEKEGEKFLVMVQDLTEDDFNKICDEFFEALEHKDLILRHKGLAIFDEIDKYPGHATPGMLRRLRRIRESTHEEIYKIRNTDGRENFIIFKGQLYFKKW